MSKQYIPQQTNRRIFLIAFLIATLILVNGGFAYWQMQQVKDEFYDVANRDLPLIAQLQPLIDGQFDQTLLIEELSNLEHSHRNTIVNTLEVSFIRAGNKFTDTLTSLDLFVKPLLKAEREDLRIEMEKIRGLLTQIATEHEQYQRQVIAMIEASKLSHAEYPDDVMQLLDREEQELRLELINVRDEVQNFTQKSALSVEKLEIRVIQEIVTFTIFVYFLGAVMLYLMLKVMRSRDAAVEEITFYATHDSLTKMHNKRYFFERLNEAIKAATRYKTSLSLCICDLDYFKQINDTLGHKVGDDVLIYFSKLIKQEKRDDDIVGRFGGDEFLLCFPNTEAAEMVSFLERIRTKLEQKIFDVNTDKSFSVTATFGVAALDFEQASKEALFESADQALYQAKEQGRNQVVVVKVQSKGK